MANMTEKYKLRAELEDRITKVSAKLAKAVEKDAKKMVSAYKLVSKELDRMIGKMNTLEKAIEKVKREGQGLGDAVTVGGGTGGSSRGGGGTWSPSRKRGGTFGSGRRRTGPRGGGGIAGALSGFTSIGGTSAASPLSSLLGGLGKLGVVGAGVATSMGIMTYGVRKSTRAFGEFDEMLDAVTVKADTTQVMMDEMREKAMHLGATTKFTAREVGEGMLYLVQAGLDAQQVVDSIEPSLKLARAGMFNLGVSADILSNALTIFSLNTKESIRVADSLTYAATKTNTNVEQLGIALSRAGGMAVEFGLTIEQTAMLMGILGDRGIQAARAGEILRMVLRQVLVPTEEGAKHFKTLGVNLRDNEGYARDMVMVINDLVDALERIEDPIKKNRIIQDIFQREATTHYLALTADIRKFKEAMAIDVADTMGEATRQMQAMDDNIKIDLIEIQSLWDNIFIRMGEINEGPLRTMASMVKGILRGATKLGDFWRDPPEREFVDQIEEQLAKERPGSTAALQKLVEEERRKYGVGLSGPTPQGGPWGPSSPLYPGFDVVEPKRSEITNPATGKIHSFWHGGYLQHRETGARYDPTQDKSPQVPYYLKPNEDLLFPHLAQKWKARAPWLSDKELESIRLSNEMLPMPRLNPSIFGRSPFHGRWVEKDGERVYERSEIIQEVAKKVFGKQPALKIPELDQSIFIRDYRRGLGGSVGDIGGFLQGAEGLSDVDKGIIRGQLSDYADLLKTPQSVDQLVTIRNYLWDMMAQFGDDAGKDAFIKSFGKPITNEEGEMLANFRESLKQWLSFTIWDMLFGDDSIWTKVQNSARLLATNVATILVNRMSEYIVDSWVMPVLKIGWEWLKEFTAPILKPIKQGVEWAWDELVQPVLGKIWQGVGWLWDKLIQPVLTKLFQGVGWIWDKLIRPILTKLFQGVGWIWDKLIRPVLTKLSQGVGWLWDKLIQPALTKLYQGVGWLWDKLIQPALGKIWQGVGWLWDNFVKPILGYVWQAVGWLWDVFIKPILEVVLQGVKWAWETFIKPVLEPIIQWVSYKFANTAADAAASAAAGAAASGGGTAGGVVAGSAVTGGTTSVTAATATAFGATAAATALMLAFFAAAAWGLSRNQGGTGYIPTIEEVMRQRAELLDEIRATGASSANWSGDYAEFRDILQDNGIHLDDTNIRNLYDSFVAGDLGFRQGGIIPGSYQDPVPIIAHGNEMVLTPAQQSQLFNIAQGRSGAGGGNTYVTKVELEVKALDVRDFQDRRDIVVSFMEQVLEETALGRKIAYSSGIAD